jgi:hypothetical protein
MGKCSKCVHFLLCEDINTANRCKVTPWRYEDESDEEYDMTPWRYEDESDEEYDIGCKHFMGTDQVGAAFTSEGRTYVLSKDEIIRALDSAEKLEELQVQYDGMVHQAAKYKARWERANASNMCTLNPYIEQLCRDISDLRLMSMSVKKLAGDDDQYEPGDDD